ncbi:hypothetical protein FGO68_gene4148 [Halteria grandinella]|uniref:Uncharacterized protein n=1 Tax=Halteria grandinella TaxID=5974 RepID=A0A8J8NBI1_HALGN|nr:hypothetical protein FGO68_gene4148 [Halteria grandinella]
MQGIVSPSIKIRETPILIIRVLLKGSNSLWTLQQTNAPSRKLKNHSGKVESIERYRLNRMARLDRDNYSPSQGNQ